MNFKTTNTNMMIKRQLQHPSFFNNYERDLVSVYFTPEFSIQIALFKATLLKCKIYFIWSQ